MGLGIFFSPLTLLLVSPCKKNWKVKPMIESVNETDMSHRCHQLVDVNTLKENDCPQAIPVQSDGMYHNPPVLGGWGRHPSSRQHRLCTHSPKISQINIKLLKWSLKTRYGQNKETQVCANEGAYPFPRGDNNKIVEINLPSLKNWANFNQTWHKESFG